VPTVSNVHVCYLSGQNRLHARQAPPCEMLQVVVARHVVHIHVHMRANLLVACAERGQGGGPLAASVSASDSTLTGSLNTLPLFHRNAGFGFFEGAPVPRETTLYCCATHMCARLEDAARELSMCTVRGRVPVNINISYTCIACFMRANRRYKP
jgi:hypothetical protein